MAADDYWFSKRCFLKEAREKLKELRRLVADGIDPRNARAATKAENTQAVTMQALFNSWIEFIKISSNVTAVWISGTKIVGDCI
ncbi:Uncharacterised protein [Legionella hackeliae]|uniref:Arm DNA-binding domain-containing protein n=1 Tax=Legionella hackeliae TaxID=449 RepID=UPI000E153A36|nr:Arm DNA-binding domain-containing protein [Legionella hackeliae]STX47799.1 Uncharacterised protein [Legionella hackeliae]